MSKMRHKVNYFMQTFAVLNLDFFSLTGCHTKAKKKQFAQLFTISRREKNWIHTFPKGIRTM